MADIEPGTKVRWMDSRTVGRSFRFTQKTGRLVSTNGPWSIVKAGNGRELLVKTADLEPDGKGPSQLTRALFGDDVGKS